MATILRRSPTSTTIRALGAFKQSPSHRSSPGGRQIATKASSHSAATRTAKPTLLFPAPPSRLLLPPPPTPTIVPLPPFEAALLKWASQQEPGKVYQVMVDPDGPLDIEKLRQHTGLTEKFTGWDVSTMIRTFAFLASFGGDTFKK